MQKENKNIDTIKPGAEMQADAHSFLKTLRSIIHMPPEDMAGFYRSNDKIAQLKQEYEEWVNYVGRYKKQVDSLQWKIEAYKAVLIMAGVPVELLDDPECIEKLPVTAADIQWAQSQIEQNKKDGL